MKLTARRNQIYVLILLGNVLNSNLSIDFEPFKP